MKDKIYLIEKGEFVLLAAIAGINRMYGFEVHADEMLKEEALEKLQNMVSKGYINTLTGKFVLSEELSEVFSIIKDVQTVMDIHKSSGRKCILYVSDKVAKVAQSLRRRDVFEISEIEKNDVWSLLVDEGWIPE